MPLFFLHIFCDGETVLDEEGIDYADLAAAEREAIRGARSIISAEVMAGRLRLDEAILVHDREGRHLSTICFSDVIEILPIVPAASKIVADDRR